MPAISVIAMIYSMSIALMYNNNVDNRFPTEKPIFIGERIRYNR